MSGMDKKDDGYKKLIRKIEKEGKYKVLELSHGQLNDKLRNTVMKAVTGEENMWVAEVYDKTFIYEVNKGDGYKLYKQGYAVTADDSVELVGDAIEVERKMEYMPVKTLSKENKSIKQGGNKMDRKQRVKALIADEKSKWGQEDEKLLTEMSDDQFSKLEEPFVKANDESNDGLTTPVKEEVKAKGKGKELEEDVEVEVKVEEKPRTAEQFFANAPAEVKETYEQAVKINKATKEKFIKAIKSNSENPFSDEELAGKSISDLEKLSKLGRVTVDFSGQSPDLVTNADDDMPDPMPSLDDK